MANNHIELHFHPRACSIVPHILLNEAGISFIPHVVQLESMTADFATKNPKKQVPVLVVDDNVITENPAVIHAINQLAPRQQFMGRNPIEFIRVCEWLNFCSASVHAQAWGPFLRPWRYTTDPSSEAQAAVKAKSAVNLREQFDSVESQLRDGVWAVGDSFTAADAYLLCFFRWATWHNLADMGSTYPKWAKLMQRVNRMESVKDVLENYERIEQDFARNG